MTSKLSHGSGGVSFRRMRQNSSEELCIISDVSYVKISLDGYNGETAVPAVSSGDKVLAGQLIADSDGEFSVPIYSGISGTVTGIEEKQDIYGELRRFIIIRGDGSNQTVTPEPYSKRLADSSPDELIEFIRKTGVAGREKYPLWKNISESRGAAKQLIINAVPCDPDDKVSHCVILEYAERLLCGIKIILKALELRHAVIVLSDSMKRQAEKLEHFMEAEGSSKLFSVVFAAERYPLYEDGQVINSVTGANLINGKRPYEIGYAVIDAVSCVELFASFSEGLPCTNAVLSVGGDCPRKPKTVILPYGSEISVLENICGGFWERPLRIIAGGRMRGRVYRENDTVDRGMRLLQFDCVIENREIKNCIRCGKCVEVCPAHLAPIYLSNFSALKNTKKCISFRIKDCTECGCCSYICPCGIPLVKNIRLGKKLVYDATRKEAGAPDVRRR
ncbi:MAG: RnfABCDGE type electron transport complex subunit C [Clostridia bacterium]|nr:RnfABCDGE type electron transport complex subunit C [Clostridia bacterium]